MIIVVNYETGYAREYDTSQEAEREARRLVKQNGPGTCDIYDGPEDSVKALCENSNWRLF